MEKIEYPAIKLTQGKYNFYLTVIPSTKLKEYCYISRRNEDKEEGFQRLLNKPRAKLIQKYYEEGGTIPSPLILSVKEDASFEYSTGKISFYEKDNILLVIDGQHRLFGIYGLEEQIDIPVVLFESLSLTEEVNLFIDINTNQKGVPSALLLDIKNLAQKENKTETRQRELFDYLNSNGPLKDKLLSSASKTGYISRTAFNEVTTDIFENGILREQSNNILFGAILNFLSAFEKMYEESGTEATLTKTIFFKVAMRFFDLVIKESLTELGNAKVDSIYSIIEPLAVIDYQKFTGTNRQTEKDLYQAMEDILFKRKVIKISAEDIF